MTSSIFKLGQDEQALHDLLIEVGGDVTDATVEAAINAWMAEIDANRQAVFERTGAVIRRLAADAKVAEEEAKRLRELQRVRENGVERLKGRLLEYMQNANVKRVDTPTCVFTRQKNSQPGLDITIAAEALPPRFKRVSVEADKIEIRRALQAGEDVPGCNLLEAGEHIRIK
jgi:hypothetical protein